MVLRAPLVGMTMLVQTMGVHADQPVRDQVLIDDGKVQVTAKDFEARLSTFPFQAQEAVRGDPGKVQSVLEAIYTQRALSREAQDEGLDKDPLLSKQIQQSVDSMLAKAWLERELERENYPDFEPLARERYLVEKAKYVRPEQVKISHILITSRDRSDDEAKKLATEVRSKAEQPGADFEKLALEFSEDPSAQRNHGHLGSVTRGRMVPEFEKAAFALDKPGDLSPVIKSQFGYHIIKLHSRNDERQLSFEEVKDGIIAQLRKKHQAELRQKLIQEIKANPAIQLNKPAIQALVESNK